MEVLRPEAVQVGSRARTKHEILRDIAVLARKSPILSAIGEDDIYHALEARENIGSTGFEEGIAIPHCSLESLEDFVVGVLIHTSGIDFHAIDSKKTTIFFFIIGPKGNRNSHIQILSSISKLMKTPEVAKHLRNARDPGTIIGFLEGIFRFKEEIPEKKGSCIFHVFIQREDLFEDILQVFSAAVKGSITVVETNNAGYYLHRLPLFSAYWSDVTQTFNRLIIAVVDRDFTNDVIRRIHMVANNIEKETGVLITVQDLVYTSGSIEF
jgi:mannitol/fructose-specific phosphotransferase system IIA component (Ntr-type)